MLYLLYLNRSMQDFSYIAIFRKPTPLFPLFPERHMRETTGRSAQSENNRSDLGAGQLSFGLRFRQCLKAAEEKAAAATAPCYTEPAFVRERVVSQQQPFASLPATSAFQLSPPARASIPLSGEARRWL